jgi:hypothetical protein
MIVPSTSETGRRSECVLRGECWPATAPQRESAQIASSGQSRSRDGQYPDIPSPWSEDSREFIAGRGICRPRHPFPGVKCCQRSLQLPHREAGNLTHCDLALSDSSLYMCTPSILWGYRW